MLPVCFQLSRPFNREPFETPSDIFLATLTTFDWHPFCSALRAGDQSLGGPYWYDTRMPTGRVLVCMLVTLPVSISVPYRQKYQYAY